MSTMNDSNSTLIQFHSGPNTQPSGQHIIPIRLSASDHAAESNSILINPALSSTPGPSSLATSPLPVPNPTQYNLLYVPILKWKLKQLGQDAALGRKIS